MEPTEKELIDHIRKVLISEEFAYKEGAWENFASEQSKKRIVPLWMKITASAAVVFLVISVVWYQSLTKSRGIDIQHVVVKHSGLKKTSPSDLKTIAEVWRPERKAVQKQQVQHSIVRGSISNRPVQQEMSQVVASVTTNQNNQFVRAVATENKESSADSVSALKKEKLASVFVIPKRRTLADLPPEPQQRTTEKYKNWKIELMLAQGAGAETKMSSAYGASVGFRLNSRFSISSGAAYTQLKAEKQLQNVSATEVGKNLTSVQSNLGGIDVPLEINYTLTKKLYVSAGFTANVILSQKNSMQYINNTVKIESYVNGEGLVSNRERIVSFKTEEPIPKEQTGNERYVGYYNFSVGYQQKLPSGHLFIIEPFIKLPVQEFSRENIKLNTLGVRLRYTIQ